MKPLIVKVELKGGELVLTFEHGFDEGNCLTVSDTTEAMKTLKWHIAEYEKRARDPWQK